MIQRATRNHGPIPLTHAGVLVPWVARWTSEVDPTPLLFNGQLRYPDGQERRELGVLWLRERHHNQGFGTPDFRTVSTNRQLSAMLNRLCQVCGRQAPSKPTTWLLPAPEAVTAKPHGQPFTTATPPVCPTCIPLALTYCPHLRSKVPMVLDVWDYRPCAVVGEYLDNATRQRAKLPLDDERLPKVLGHQLVVEIREYDAPPP